MPPELDSTPTAGAHLYIIQTAQTGDIKVGRSSDPDRRRRELQTGCGQPLRVILVALNAGYREKSIHRRMRHLAIRHEKGEWFTEAALAELPTDLYDLLDLETSDWWISR